MQGPGPVPASRSAMSWSSRASAPTERQRCCTAPASPTTSTAPLMPSFQRRTTGFRCSSLCSATAQRPLTSKRLKASCKAATAITPWEPWRRSST